MPNTRRSETRSLIAVRLTFVALILMVIVAAIATDKTLIVRSASHQFTGPDLIPTNFTFSPATVFDGGSITFSFTVSNQGDNSAPASTSGMALVVAGDASGVCPTPSLSMLWELQTPALDPGESVSQSATFNLAAAAGLAPHSWTVAVLVDRNNSTGEDASAHCNNLLIGAQQLTVTPASSVGWPMDGFNPQRTNRSTSAGPSTLPNFKTIATHVSGVIRRIGFNGALILTGTDSVSSYSSTGQLMWITNVPGTVDVAIASTGTVYVSSAGSVLALNKDTGAILWTYNANVGNLSWPMAIGSDDVIYFHSGSSFVGVPNKLSAINADGTKKWEIEVAGQDRPVLSNDESLAYLLINNPSGFGGTVLAIDTANGQTFLASDNCDSRGGVYAFSPSGSLYTGETNDNLLAHSQSLQACSFVPTNDPVGRIVTFSNSGNLVIERYFSLGSIYFAITPQGTRVWTSTDQFSRGIADKNGIIYTTIGNANTAEKSVVALDSATGNQLWRSSFPNEISGMFLGTDGSLYLTCGTSLIKTAAASSGELLPYRSTGYRYQIVAQGDPTPTGFEHLNFDDSSWAIGSSAFGFSSGLCSLASTIATPWDPTKDLYVRKSVSVPQGTSNLKIMVSIDNDIQDIFFNGVHIFGPAQHEDCPALDDFVVDVPQNLVNFGENLVAYHLRDRGGETYFDTRITAISEPSPTPTPTPTPSPTPTNQRPIAGFTMSLGSKSATDGQTLSLALPAGPFLINFSADRSFDPDGTISAWQWKIDGIKVSTSRSFKYVASGHVVSLTVTDNEGAASDEVVGFVNIVPLRSLKLFAVNDPDGPLVIRTENRIISADSISADVIIENLSGTWFELDIDFDAGTAEAPHSISSNNVPFVSLIGPSGALRFRTSFREGEYLHYRATRTSLAALTMLAIDLIGRGLLGVEINTPKGQFDLAIHDLTSLLNKVNTTCGGDAIQIGKCVGERDILCLISKLAAFIHCAVEKPEFRNLINRLYGANAGQKFVDFGSREVFKIVLDLISLFDRAPKIAVLYDATVRARTDSFVRLEARR